MLNKNSHSADNHQNPRNHYTKYNLQRILPRSVNEPVVCVWIDETEGPNWNGWMGLRRTWDAM